MEKEVILALKFNTKTGDISDVEVLNDEEIEEVVSFTIGDFKVKIPEELTKYITNDILGLA